MRTLPESHRHLLQLFFYEDLQLSECARRLGHHKSWASRVLSASLCKLREAFEAPPMCSQR
jgi:DNA-directed RNA polymerase specialized sigma subunit